MATKLWTLACALSCVAHCARPSSLRKGRAGSTSLHEAVLEKRPDIVLKLLLAGADVNQLSVEGETPLLLAAGAGSLESVRLLIAYGADPDMAWKQEELGQSHTPLWRASYTGHVDVVRELLKAGARIEDDRHPPITAASSEGHLGVVEALLEYGATPDASNRIGATGLMNACTSGHALVVDALLKANANPNIVDENGTHVAIGIAAQHGYIEIVRALLRAGADPDGKPHKSALGNWSVPLFAATCHNHTDIVRLLLNAGAHAFKMAKQEDQCMECDGTYVCGSGRTLDLASHKGNREIEKMLVQGIEAQRIEIEMDRGHADETFQIQPIQVTVYMDDDTQDVECRRTLLLANERAQDKYVSDRGDELARGIELYCKPPLLPNGVRWQPAVLEEWTYKAWHMLANDNVHTYERFGDADNRSGHYLDLPGDPASMDQSFDERMVLSLFDRVHFLVRLSDGSAVHYGNASINDYHFERLFPDGDDGGRPEEPWIEFNNHRVLEPELWIYLNKEMGYYVNPSSPLDDPEVSISVHFDFYRVSSAPCWSCGSEHYASVAHSMQLHTGKKLRHPSEIRHRFLRLSYESRMNGTLATDPGPDSLVQLMLAQSPFYAAFVSLFALLGMPWLVTRHFEKRRRCALAARALDAARKATEAEQARQRKKERKQELERQRQERQLEAMRRAESKREADQAAYTQSEAEREAARRRHELALRERARREAEAALNGDKPLSMPGPSHQAPKAKTATRTKSQTQEARARREAEKARSIEAQHAHTAALREKEAARVEEVMKRLEMRRLGDRIASGDRSNDAEVYTGMADPHPLLPMMAPPPARRGAQDGDEALARRLSRLCGACEEREVMPGRPWCTDCHWLFQHSFTICEWCGNAPPTPGYRLCQPCSVLAQGDDEERRGRPSDDGSHASSNNSSSTTQQVRRHCDWVATLPVRQYLGSGDALQGQVAECIICQEEYEPGVELTMCPCAHTFHAMCARSWFEKQPACPICLTDVKKSVARGGV